MFYADLRQTVILYVCRCVLQEAHIMENGDVSRAGLKWLGAAGWVMIALLHN